MLFSVFSVTPHAYFYIVAEGNEARALDTKGKFAGISDRIAAMDALGAEGWIISPNEIPTLSRLDTGWLFDFIISLAPTNAGKLYLEGRYFMRRPIDEK